jgi:hypothetical protein
MALCSSCRIKAQVGSVTPQPAPRPKKDIPKRPALGKLAFFCTNCRYRFKADASGDMPRCPYCGRSTKVTPVKETSADELLRNSVE